MRYTDFVLVATEPRVEKAEGKKHLIFNLFVPGIFNEPMPRELDLRALDSQRDKARGNDADWEDVRLLGEALAAALLPKDVGNALNNRITQAAALQEGVRVRLMLSGSELNHWPWEFMIFNRAGGEDKVSDFLALMPNVSLVRHAATPLPAWRIEAKAPVKMIVAVASPTRWPKLKVADECAIVVNALQGSRVTVERVEHAQRNQLPDKTNPAHLFHFAGHGNFETVQSAVPGMNEGKASIILEDEYGDEDLLDAELLALRLREAGVRVAVLGACQTAQRDDVGAWSSVAETLLKAELGAVVGMQFPVLDKSALRFAERFYRALAVGLSIDEAVVSGRVAVAASGDARGWATPVLYLRSPDGAIFPELESQANLMTERDQTRMRIYQEIGVLDGSAVGLKIGQIELNGSNAGKEMQDIARALTAMNMDVATKVGVISKTGSATGVEIGSIKHGRRSSNKKDGSS